MKNINRIRTFTSRRWATLGLALISAALIPLVPLASAEDKTGQPHRSENAAVAKRAASSSTQTNRPCAALKTLSGAELYSMHCNRCHPERYPTERTAAQWKTILLHMRVRANLPAEQSRTILRYLQDNSGR